MRVAAKRPTAGWDDAKITTMLCAAHDSSKYPHCADRGVATATECLVLNVPLSNSNRNLRVISLHHRGACSSLEVRQSLAKGICRQMQVRHVSCKELFTYKSQSDLIDGYCHHVMLSLSAILSTRFISNIYWSICCL